MRIIKEGKNPIKEIEHTCKGCDAVFAYGWNDLIDTGFHIYVQCPCCGLCVESKLKDS